MKTKIDKNNQKAFLEMIGKRYKDKVDIALTQCQKLYDDLCQQEVAFRVNSQEGLMDYVMKYLYLHQLQQQLREILQPYILLVIDRVEYERLEQERTVDRSAAERQIATEQSFLAADLSTQLVATMTAAEKDRYRQVEGQLHRDHLFAKDIELLKKVLQENGAQMESTYDEGTCVRRLSIWIPQSFSAMPIKAKLGSREYEQHITRNLVRMERLLKHLKQYIVPYELEGNNSLESSGYINQSAIIQDSVNIAMATFGYQVYQAISGHDEIQGYSAAPSLEEAAFVSYKVNRHGQLGVGYDRRMDSEKKILETIHAAILAKRVAATGELILYTKWEPCPSCYLVIHQFQACHPGIKIKVKYASTYGLVK